MGRPESKSANRALLTWDPNQVASASVAFSTEPWGTATHQSRPHISDWLSQIRKHLRVSYEVQSVRVNLCFNASLKFIDIRRDNWLTKPIISQYIYISWLRRRRLWNGEVMLQENEPAHTDILHPEDEIELMFQMFYVSKMNLWYETVITMWKTLSGASPLFHGTSESLSNCPGFDAFNSQQETCQTTICLSIEY